MVAITAWSYSRFACYALCPLQFKLRYIDKVPEPTSPAMVRGNEIHKQLAAFVTNKGPLPAEIKSANHRSLCGEIAAWLAEDKVVEQQWGFTAQWAPTAWFGKTTWYRQVLDVGVMYEDLTGEVIDWKTGKRYVSNADQMELCALSFMCQYKLTKHVTTRLVYVDQGNDSADDVAEFPVAVKQHLKEKWEAKVAPMFSDTAFLPRPNDKCRFCAFSRSNSGQCRYG